jgi:hypothetical protein
LSPSSPKGTENHLANTHLMTQSGRNAVCTGHLTSFVQITRCQRAVLTEDNSSWATDHAVQHDSYKWRAAC